MSRSRFAAVLSAFGLPVLFTLGAPSCTTEAYCFVCEQHGTQSGGAAGATGDGGTGNIAVGGSGGNAGSGVDLDGGTLPDGGPSCTADTENDPLNCGMCDHVCSLLGAFATCVGGQCVIDECAEGYKDLNMDDQDGCEYVCPVYPVQEEICDGLDNNCDGEKDEGFDLTTVENCGSCGNNCELANASVACEDVNADPANPSYQCVITDCADGYKDIDKVHSNGCEYECPVWPPVAEICNELDDNCDGVVNEDNPGGGQACTDPCPSGNCRGLCEPGETRCVGNGLVCVGGKGPQAEICDGEDNDCDGVDDNGYNLNTNVLHCGACNNKCDLPNAIASCSGGQCVVAGCRAGYRDLNNNPADGCEHQCAQYPTTAEICDGIDNNCDGVVDRVSVAQPLTPPPNFCRQTGPCNGATASCVAGSWRCNYQQINANIEVNPVTGALVLEETKCDGFDGDCDGQIDESFVNKNTPCTSGQGRCARSGTFVCNAGGTGTECNASAVPGDAVAETCNGIDDDCDGQIDETAAQTGCTGVACSRATDAMVQVGSFWIYQYEASRPDAETTDVDTTRACSRPGVLPWTSVNRAAAAAACAAVANSAGNPMRLCTESEWQTACLFNSSGTGTTKWSYSSGQTVYESGVCNDRGLYPDPDDLLNLPQAWLTDRTRFDQSGAGKQCRTAGASGIFNMSGNVAEWTSTSVVVLGSTYYRVRGGSYLTYAPMTACDKNFVLNLGTFQNHDLGFRCCSGAAP
jgi:hypothetical protein